MREEFEILKQRADKFFNYALETFNKGDYEISAFELEQSAQLYLKYTMAKLIGDFPKTHSLRKLLQDVHKVTKNDEILTFLTNNENVIADLEESYLTSRYLPAEFSKNQVEKMIKCVQLLKELLNKLWI